MAQAQLPLSLLLVHSHAAVREQLRANLSSFHDLHVTAQADCGEDAISLINTAVPAIDVVLVGFKLSGRICGVETTKQIRSNGHKVAVLVVGENEECSHFATCITAGANSYILHSTNPAILRRAIHGVRDGGVWIGQDLAVRLASIIQGASERDLGPNRRSDALSSRELQVLELIVRGYSNQQIAENLVISLATAKAHVRSILNKMGVTDRTQAAVQAMKRGMFDSLV